MSTISELGHEARVLGQFALVGKDEIDLLDVLGAKPVLVLALCVFAIGVDEEDLVLECVGLALVADQHAGGDARAVEEAGRQADDGLDAVVIYEELADELFLTTTEQDPVRHDRRHPAVGLEAGEHVLHEHEVRLLAGLRAPLAEATGELHARRGCSSARTAGSRAPGRTCGSGLLSRMSGSSSVSPFSIVDRVMLWRIMFMMQIDQTVPLESWP